MPALVVGFAKNVEAWEHGTTETLSVAPTDSVHTTHLAQAAPRTGPLSATCTHPSLKTCAQM